MKKSLIIVSIATAFLLLHACSGGEKKEAPKEEFNSKEYFDDSESKEAGEKSNKDDKRGLGKFTKVEVGATLDKTMAASGEKVYDLKCSACHKLTAEKLVGPGWKEVTTRRSAEWIMNFATNTDEMIDKDPQVQAMLEECMVRMPNQNLSDDDARTVYEFMRKNDGVK